MRKDISFVVAALTIVVLLLGLFGYKSLPELFKPIVSNNDVPFDVKISPEYFNEGYSDYQDSFPISLKVIPKQNRNITTLELSKDNFKITREDRGLNKPRSKYIVWETPDYQRNIISYPSSSWDYNNYLEAKGKLLGCDNCFIGDNYPYVFTFTIYYKEDESELKSKTFSEIIPIK